MTPLTDITCTKSELANVLRETYAKDLPTAMQAELDAHLASIVAEAQVCQGVYQAYDEYLGLDITVTSDLRICCTTYPTEAHEPGCTRKAPETTQCAEYYSARRAVDKVAEALAQMMSRELNANRLNDLAAMLTAAADHVRVAEEHEEG